MKKLKKTLCDYDRKDIEKHRKLFEEAVANPTHLCVKCARASNRPDLLCKAEEVGK